jgi:hypothetical protein
VKLLRRRKFVIPAIAGIVALIGAGVAYGFFTTSGSGTGSAAIGDASPLTVAVGTPTGGSLYPASFTDGDRVVDTVDFTVTNPGSGNVNLGTVVAGVTPGWTFTDGAGDPACTAADFSINGQAVGAPAITTGSGVTLNGSSDAPNNVYKGSFTIQMVDNGANQDSCQSGSVPLTVTTGTPNLLNDIAYFTDTISPAPFTRSLTPIVSPPVDESVSAGPSVTVAINDATGTTYVDSGFYINLGTLGSLSGYTIQGTGSQFGTNLYFNTNPPSNDFFNWAANMYTNVPGNTSYILGPTSVSGTITVTGSSGNFVSPTNTTCSVSPVTLADLKAGDCSGITLSTPVAVWVGDTLGSGDGTLSTTFTSVTAS